MIHFSVPKRFKSLKFMHYCVIRTIKIKDKNLNLVIVDNLVLISSIRSSQNLLHT